MSSITQHISLPKDVATKDDLDFYFLREKGIEYIEELGGALWTDLNSHDPGVTILEMLCYAITDLGNRIELPLENLLSSENSDENIGHQFYKAEDVFPNKPLTAHDYRKILIDVDGVRNCWLRKYERKVYVNTKDDQLSYNQETFAHLDPSFQKEFTIKGLYTVLVEFDELREELSDEEKEAEIAYIKSQIKEKFHQNRNLCEDLVDISTIDIQKISVCADIEVEKDANEEEVHANVLFEIEKYFSPKVNFYSLQEMLDKDYTPDQIFEGPLLDNGFIDTTELIDADLRQEVRLSDLMKIIMKIEGVKLIRDISIGHCDSKKELENSWVICIDHNKKPVMCDQSAFSYHKGVLPLNINKKEVEKFLTELQEEEREARALAKLNKVLKVPQGIYSATNSYTTIMNDFPDTYGIGQAGLSAQVTKERKAKAKQLKSYLVFFDKILASYFQHLGKVKDLLSINGEETKTFFSQALSGIKGFDDLVKEYPSDNDQITDLVFKQFDNNVERRNLILDHLLARFAESFGDYAFLMNMLYGSAADEVTLNSKSEFLKDYVAISSERGCGFNYYRQPIENLWNTTNISGFQKRVSRLLGVKDYSRRHLTQSFVRINELLDDDNKVTYSWDILDGEGAVLLSSTKTYLSISRASYALYDVVLLITQTFEKDIEKRFEGGIEGKDNTLNIEPFETESGTFKLKVIDVSEKTTWTEEGLAKHAPEYDDLETLQAKVLELINFVKQDFTEEGMFLVEHILLRPNVTNDEAAIDNFMPICTDDCGDGGCGMDPYSFRVSIVLPGYTYRFSNPDFRNYMENIIREELPAHIVPRICWVGNRRGQVPDDENDLWNFENAYKNYLEAKTMLEQEQPTTGNNEHKELIKAMNQLNTIYPEGRLLDCADESDEIEGRVILGQTNLGTLKTESNGD
jgi:hypothetical protein